mmetsp:Transcript_3863/g.9555  ORF Transcript_3863/g.9555 Transcript_3863/m.9555 type:complete len:292 (-) Transcript_3863:216-1091(-)
MLQRLLSQRPPVASDAPARPQGHVDLDRIFRRGMVFLHELAGKVCSDRNQRAVDSSDSPPDLLEHRTVSGVSGKEESWPSFVSDNPAAPQGLASVEGGTGGPMLAGSTYDFHVATEELNRLPPVHLDHVGNAFTLEPLLQPQPNVPYGAVAQLPDRLQVEMVIVTVRDDDEVYPGELVDSERELCIPPWPHEGHGRRAAREDRIGEEVQPADLNEEGGVPYPCQGDRACRRGADHLPVGLAERQELVQLRLGGEGSSLCLGFVHELEHLESLAFEHVMVQPWVYKLPLLLL